VPFCRTFEAMQLAPTLRLGHGARMQRSSGAERLATTRPVLQRATLRDKAARIRSNTCECGSARAVLQGAAWKPL
jgi:hypothetical protein